MCEKNLHLSFTHFVVKAKCCSDVADIQIVLLQSQQLVYKGE